MNFSAVAMATGSLSLLAACTTQGEISNAGIQEVTVVGESLRAVATQQITETSYREERSNDGGYFLVELTSRTDFERVVLDKEMSSLYYVLQACNEPGQSQELLAGSVFVDTKPALPGSNQFSFFAPVPRNIVGAISRHQAMLGKTGVTFPSSLCIRLGAGNMAGQVLETNLVPLGIDIPTSE